MDSVLLPNQNSLTPGGGGGAGGGKQTSALGAKQILFYPLLRVKGNYDLGVKQMQNEVFLQAKIERFPLAFWLVFFLLKFC